MLPVHTCARAASHVGPFAAVGTDPPSPEEAARLLSAAWEDPDWGLLIWLTMITGRRRGEVSALRWSSVDIDRAQLIVDRSNVQPKAGVIESRQRPVAKLGSLSTSTRCR